MTDLIDQLCLKCGLCCNGVLFRDVVLQRGDDPERLVKRKMPLEPYRNSHRFSQPCAALEGCRCRIYADRPLRCRQFECGLFKAVAAGKLKQAVALKMIQQTQQQAERVKGMLRQVGDREEDRALSLRFQKARRNMGDIFEEDEAMVEVFSELTLAVHDLNLRLRGLFYPGDQND